MGKCSWWRETLKPFCRRSWNPTLRKVREGWGTRQTKINPNVKSVGQECPTHTDCFNSNSKGKSKINTKVKSIGQECPTHTGCFNSNSKGKSKINTKVKGVGRSVQPTRAASTSAGKTKINTNVKGVGQECPTHTGNTKGNDTSHFPAGCSTHSHL